MQRRRQPSSAGAAALVLEKRDTGPTTAPDGRGVLRSALASGAFAVTRHTPAADLAPFVERYWVVRWSLPSGVRHVQDTLAYPCIDLVFERGNARVWGVIPGRFRRRFAGRGCVFGVKFKPGGLFPFWGTSVACLTGRTLAGGRVFRSLVGTSGRQFTQALLEEESEERQVDTVEAALRRCLPALDPDADRAARCVSLVLHDRSFTRVDALSKHLGVSTRTLERSFRRYVGVSPKWVLRRFRLMEAAAQVDAGFDVDWAALASALGYCDQAHLINDFRQHVGVSPARYAKETRQSTTRRPEE